MSAASVSLGWDPNTEANITGYRLYYGTASGAYSNSLDVGLGTQATVGNLGAGQTYFFAVTAYNASGIESARSGEISHTVPAPNQAPVVAVTSPSEGSSYVAPASVTFSATATDADGSIVKVEYFNGVTKLGEATSSPYSFTWNSVPGGNYSVRAVATDNMGATATSAAVNFAVVVLQTNQAPSVSIASNGTAFVAPASVAFTANASDADGVVSRVEYFSGATKLGEATASPYSFAWSSVPPGSYSVTAKATDNQGAVGMSAPINIVVSAPNQPPTISDVSNQIVNEDTPTAAIVFTVGDPESASGSLVVSGSSSNLALVPNTSLVFGGSGASRTVTITPAANQSGTATITLNVSDGQLSASDTFVLTVNAVNDAPVISDIANRVTSEDSATGSISFTVGDAETAAGSLVVSGSSSNPVLVPNGNIVFSGGGASRTVSVTPAANQSGTATITVSVSDGQASATDTFVLTVNAVNDAPTIGDVANQAIAANTTTSALSFTVGDLETAAGSLVLSGNSSNQALVPNGNIVFGGSGASRTVTVTPAANQSGTATITLSVSDGQASAADTFVLTVAAPNQSPSVTLTSSGSSFLAPASYTLTANATDADGAIAKVEFYTGSTKIGEKTAAPYTWTLSNVAEGNYSHYAIAVDDSGASSTSNAAAVAVTGANAAPIVSLTSPQNGSTFNSPATVNLAASASDSDGTIARVEFFSGSTLLGTSSAAPYSCTWSDVPGGVYYVRCVAYDNLGASATSSTVKVTVNASPTVAVAVTGNFTAGGSMTITATASDSDGSIRQVEFYSGSVLLGKDKNSPYSFIWRNIPSGTHTITAVAYDNKGASTRSAPVMVGVTANSQAPVVSKTLPTVRALGTGYEGTFEIEVLGEAGQMYDVWTSQDLTNWSLMSSVLNAEGTVVVTDSSETPQTSRFYRVSLR